MHRLPETPKLQFLVGSELEHVGLGQWQVQFNFDKARIGVEGGFEHVDKTGRVRRHNTDEDHLFPIFLHHLLGQEVSTVEAERFCLTLVFDGGDIIRIFSDEGPYECGQIYVGDDLLFVF